MLNKPESSRTTWLKYPVLGIATLTVVAAFARPSNQTLQKFVPAAVAKTVASVVAPMVTKSSEPSPIVKEVIRLDSARKMPIHQQPDVTPSVALVNSPSITSGSNVVPKSGSRYIMQQGDYIYWIMTPRMSLDDLMILKQELAQYGCLLRLDELKYDPLHAYIENLAFWAMGPRGGRDHVNEVEQASRIPVPELKHINLPLPTVAGYLIRNPERNLKDHNVWSTRLDGRFHPKFPLYQTPGEVNFPVALRTIAAEDEAAVFRFINQNRMAYLVLAGERKFSPLGIGFRKIDKETIKKEARLGSFIQINSGGFFSVDTTQNFTKIFINNEPASHEAIRHINISQLHTLAITLGYDNVTQKRSGTDYLMFYINEDN